MTQGEKANRYDEIIEKAKSKIKNDKDHVLYEDDVIEMLPELKGSTESEDEKIRKAIIEIVKKDEERIGTNAHLKKIQWLEKQGEQNPAWSEEDEEKLNLIIARLHSHTNVEAEEYGKDYHWLKSLKDRVQPQHTWKPSDEQMDALSFCLKYVDNDGVFGRQLVKLYQNLKNLKEE